MIQVYRVQNQEDYRKVREVRNLVFTQEQGVPEEMEVDAFEKHSVHFLAESDGVPLGAGRFRIKKSILKFERIATLPESRGKGVGRAIMEKMQEIAESEYPEYLPAMHAQKDSIPFYLKLGWVPVSEEFEKAGITHQVLIFPPKEKEKIRKLKCLSDPQTRPEINRYLQGVLQNGNQ